MKSSSLVFATAAVLLICFGATSASAGTLSLSGSDFTFTASPGETNDFSIIEARGSTADDVSVWVLDDNPITLDKSTSRCENRGASAGSERYLSYVGKTAWIVCPMVNVALGYTLTADLGDNNDASAGSGNQSLFNTVTYRGDEGDDTLFAWESFSSGATSIVEGGNGNDTVNLNGGNNSNVFRVAGDPTFIDHVQCDSRTSVDKDGVDVVSGTCGTLTSTPPPTTDAAPPIGEAPLPTPSLALTATAPKKFRLSPKQSLPIVISVTANAKVTSRVVAYRTSKKRNGVQLSKRTISQAAGTTQRLKIKLSDLKRKAPAIAENGGFLTVSLSVQDTATNKLTTKKLSVRLLS